MKSMVKWRRLFGRGSRQTGGDFLCAHLEATAGGAPLEIHGELRFSDEVAVLVYRVDKPVLHLLYVTYGVSRTRSSAPVAGMQDELTLRVPDQHTPPEWPVQRLRSLARYLRKSGNSFAPGHYMDLHEPVCEGATLTGFIFVADPLIPLLNAPTGRIRFLNAVPVTDDELEAALCWDPLKFAGKLGDVVPLGVGKHDRASSLIDAAVIPLIQAEGSSIAAVASKFFAVDETGRIDLTTRAAAHLLRAMKWRLGFERPFAIVGEKDSGWARFVPASEAHVAYGNDESGAHITVDVDHALRHEILAVVDFTPGTYTLTSAPLTLQVIDPKR